MSDRMERLAHLTPQQLALLETRLREKAAAHARLSLIERRSTAWAPMTFAQRALWFLDQRYPGSAAYNISLVLQLDGELLQNVLVESLNVLIQRHEALRTIFLCRGEDFVQEFLPPYTFPLKVRICSDLSSEQAYLAVQKQMMEEAKQSFDLAQGPLMRGSLYQLDATSHILHLVTHHIIFDTWSMKNFYAELGQIYTCLCSGRSFTHLPELPIQYGDYAAWQHTWLKGEQAREQLLYWTQHLQGVPLFLQFPADKPRSSLTTSRGKRLNFAFPEDVMQAIRSLSQQENITVYNTLLAAWSLLLSFYLGKEDIVVGSPTANRRTETLPLIGFFANTLLLRCDLSGNPSFLDLLQRIKTVTREAMMRQDLPYEFLIQELPGKPAPGEGSSLQIKFLYQNVSDILTLALPDLQTQFLDVSTETAKFDLLLDIVDIVGETVGEIEYRTDLFYTSTIAALPQQYLQILRLAVDNPSLRYHEFQTAIPIGRRDHIMQKEFQEKPKKPEFKKMQPKAVNIHEQKLVQFTRLAPEEPFILVVEPMEKHISLAHWIKHNKELIASQLQASGGLLFRNFPISSIDAFQEVTRALSEDLLDYTERSTPRSTVEGKVFTSTEYPADQFIQLHSEMSYTSHWPRKIWFYCVQPATEGGATPLSDNRKVYKLIDPAVRQLFTEKRVRYVRNYGQGLDLPWQDVFQTDDRAEVEAMCQRAGISFSWQENGQLRTWQVCQAVAQHPETGEMLWFNQAHLFHVSSLSPAVRASLLAVMGYEDLPRNAYFGDGTPIDDAIVEHIRDVYRQATVRFPWRQGELLLLDNMLTAHGRDPFSGSRKVVVSMAENYTLEKH